MLLLTRLLKVTLQFSHTQAQMSLMTFQCFSQLDHLSVYYRTRLAHLTQQEWQTYAQ